MSWREAPTRHQYVPPGLPVVNNNNINDNMLPRRPQRQVLARFSVSALVASLLPLLYVSLLRPPPAALAGDTAFWFLMSNCVVAAIVAADDAGTLFFGSTNKADDDPASFSHCYNAPVTAWNTEELAMSTMTSSSSSDSVVMDGGASPFLFVHGECDDQVPIDPSTADKNNDSVVILEGSASSHKAIPGADDELIAISKAADDGALLLEQPVDEPPEPGLEEEGEEIPEAWAIAQRSRTPDLQQGKGGGGGKKLRRSATEGSRPAAAEERGYEELSDEELNRRVEEFIARFNREMRRQIEQEMAGV